MEKGVIVNLQDYSVHDGYGIRTLVFLKGCPLQCPWCQNPEAIRFDYEIKYQAQRCIECFKCEEVCPRGAIVKDRERRLDKSKCDRCMLCVQNCPSRALSQVGLEMSVEEVLRPILSYKPFYDGSEKGGVTLSGGEPTAQPEFSLALLQRCREHGIHTAMETCGYCSYEVLKSLVDHLDLVLYDVKQMDDEVHQRFAGVSNKRILDNLERVVGEGVECVVRIPLISGFNDDEGNIRETSRFVRSLGIKKLDLLPFNDLPSGKYKTLGMDWEYKHAERQSADVLERYQSIAAAYGLEVTIGGLW
jgi:pyruvate formate lyase activating enzyme